MSEQPLVKQLANWITGFDPEKIPAHVVAQAKLLLLDTIGCAVAARDEEAFVAALSTVDEIGGAPQCAVIGTRERISLPNAVFLNGTLIRALDLNDIYTGPRQNGHPSDAIAQAKARSAALTRFPSGKKSPSGNERDDHHALAITLAAGAGSFVTIPGGFPVDVTGGVRRRRGL